MSFSVIQLCWKFKVIRESGSRDIPAGVQKKCILRKTALKLKLKKNRRKYYHSLKYKGNDTVLGVKIHNKSFKILKSLLKSSTKFSIISVSVSVPINSKPNSNTKYELL